MNKKAFLIPIAAFAVTVTGAHAFSGDLLEKAGLSDEQIAAFEESRELREEGDHEAARDVLVEAGIDEETMESLREAMHKERDAMRVAIDKAIEADDYAAFLDAIEGSPLADVITSEEDFDLFKKAHAYREAGNMTEAEAIFNELGLQKPPHDGMPGERGTGERKEPPFMAELSESEQAAFKTALENHDRDAMDAILDAAGIERPTERPMGGMMFGHGNR